MERKSVLKLEKIKCEKCNKIVGKSYLNKHQETINCNYWYFYKLDGDISLKKFNKDAFDEFMFMAQEGNKFNALKEECNSGSVQISNKDLFLKFNICALLYLYFDEDRYIFGINCQPVNLDRLNVRDKPEIRNFRKNKKQTAVLENIFSDKEAMKNYKNDTLYLYTLGGHSLVWDYIKELLEIN